jgi:hypothetical protein
MSVFPNRYSSASFTTKTPLNGSEKVVVIIRVRIFYTSASIVNGFGKDERANEGRLSQSELVQPPSARLAIFLNAKNFSVTMKRPKSTRAARKTCPKSFGKSLHGNLINLTR